MYGLKNVSNRRTDPCPRGWDHLNRCSRLLPGPGLRVEHVALARPCPFRRGIDLSCTRMTSTSSSSASTGTPSGAAQRRAPVARHHGERRRDGAILATAVSSRLCAGAAAKQAGPADRWRRPAGNDWPAPGTAGTGRSGGNHARFNRCLRR